MANKKKKLNWIMEKLGYIVVFARGAKHFFGDTQRNICEMLLSVQPDIIKNLGKKLLILKLYSISKAWVWSTV